MKLVHTVQELRAELDIQRKAGKKIGLVPTMGALHEGHASLVRRAVAENEVVVVSDFVNPTQFNDKNDLLKYPRTLEADCELLEKEGAAYVFAPSVEEVYPEPDTRQFSYAPLDTVMEGKYRPGHFNGVCQIVSKLFMMVEPDKAYFGEKDFQQLAIIREMVKQMNFPLEIVGCPIVREADGLALSSRNARLSEEERRQAFVEFGLPRNIERMKRDLARYRVNFDNWFLESSLHKSGYVAETIQLLTDAGLTYEKDGAIWLKNTELGADKDEVMRRSNGFYTYYAVDIAYHRNKFVERGFDRVINVWGADHHGHAIRFGISMKAECLGLEGRNLDFLIMQMVRLVRGDEVVKVSKRTGKALTLADLMDEIIIVDTGSTDKTKEIAAEYTPYVYDFKWVNDFAAARNFAFSKATGSIFQVSGSVSIKTASPSS